MDNKLSELSKPVAQIYYDEHDSSVMRIGWLRSDEPKKPEPLYSQEYVSALTQRIADLEAIRSDASQVFKEIGNELGCNPDNESIMVAIDDLKAQVKVWESAATKHLERAEGAEKRLATPVRLSQRYETAGYCIDEHYCQEAADGDYLDRDELIASLHEQGFTVEGDE
ncbi:TPA: hypothetical protein ACKP7H_002363 [Serratia marcescens]|nr:hypothetical protein LBP97_23185 [Serratia marcescens]